MTPPARLLAHAESGRPFTVVKEAGDQAKTTKVKNDDYLAHRKPRLLSPAVEQRSVI